MIGQDVGAALIRRVERRCWIGIVGANIAAALLLIPGMYFLWPVYFPRETFGRALALAMLAAIPYLAFGSISGLHFIVRPKFRPAVRWIAESREPTQDERVRVATQPRRQSAAMLVYWIVFPMWAVPYMHLIGISFKTEVLLKFVNGLVFLGFVAWTLSYLLVERAVRPVLALALSDAPPSEPRTMGVFPRLLVAWTASAGLPLWAIAVVMYGLDATQRALVIPYVYMTCASAAVAGIIATAIAARAIIDPLEKVRTGLRAVERGELDVVVPVDEASEIGVLQMGFNRMVHGLRERDRISRLFDRHVGADVAKRAMESEHGLGGERLEVSAMFVDVIASSRLAEQKDPEAVVAVLNAFFDAVVRTVGAEEGLINKFQGDGAMCIFGAPIEQPDHATRVLRAARALSNELARLPDIEAAIGVSSGLVVAGNVGAADRYEYTVIGDPVNEASRLTERAKVTASRILVSWSTMRLAQPHTDTWSEAGIFALRGRTKPTIAYTIDLTASPI
jgi:adenylate cyclase